MGVVKSINSNLRITIVFEKFYPLDMFLDLAVPNLMII